MIPLSRREVLGTLSAETFSKAKRLLTGSSILCDYSIVYCDNTGKMCIRDIAYTIHKSQGSEFDVILMPMMYGAQPFLTRNLLYTGVTRAKRKVLVAGSMRTFEHMIGNAWQGRRATVLKRELMYLDRLTNGQME